LTAWKSKSAALGAVAVVFALAVLAAKTGEQDAARAPRPEMADDKRWQTVAPGPLFAAMSAQRSSWPSARCCADGEQPTEIFSPPPKLPQDPGNGGNCAQAASARQPYVTCFTSQPYSGEAP
jgi:hypothetical protein